VRPPFFPPRLPLHSRTTVQRTHFACVCVRCQCAVGPPSTILRLGRCHGSKATAGGEFEKNRPKASYRTQIVSLFRHASEAGGRSEFSQGGESWEARERTKGSGTEEGVFLPSKSEYSSLFSFCSLSSFGTACGARDSRATQCRSASLMRLPVCPHFFAFLFVICF